MKRWKILFIYMMAACSATACSAPNKEQSGIETMDYSNPKTVCVGRLNLKVPKETEVVYGSLNYNGSDFEIEQEVKSYQDYQKYIADKIQYLKHEPHETEGVLLKSEMSGPVNGNQGSISHIIVYRDGVFVKSIYEVYGYLYLGPKQLIVLKSGASNDLLDNSIKRMMYNLAQIKVRKKHEERAGICWNDLFIQDDMRAYRHFSNTVLLTFPSYPEVRARIENRGRYESDAPYIAMVKKNTENLPLEVKVLSKDTEIYIGEKNINGFLGEEYSANTALRKPFQRGFELMDWQYLGELDDPRRPLIAFHLESSNKMDNKGFGDALVSQKKVVDLYNFMLNSIEFSPNNEVHKNEH
ncbi:T6SS immunity protein Tli4 family protein [Acinetobacter larvae]|uniref:Tle cognate immunity protein 4 C-terminal domain-containing protein n=1 Tax=Acinetobacter larvae TaxID=1789224 RepID=A0A1B2M330_9GAMM|nr:T6SS immunity protein Tli4 family protein [Acinetobacter larvae]AOA59610.1 hypothetical protein BFG52_15495 [Acinetobacter larvae]